MAYIRPDRAVVVSARRRTFLSSVVHLADRLIRGFLAVKLSIKLRLPLFGIMLLAGCGAKNERCYENGDLSFKAIAADLCPNDSSYENALRKLNYGVQSPKEADLQWFSTKREGVCVAVPPCLVREPAPEIKPEPILTPAPEPRDVVEEAREQRDVYEAPADAGAEISDAAPAPDASTIPPTLLDAAAITEDATAEDIARRRDAQRRENGAGRDARREVFVP
ncbi:MAG: hypothetical protein WC645_00030 [Candidatus Margulisiibacteriota bacterium]